MRRSQFARSALRALAGALALMLAGCGGGTKTVSVSSAPPPGTGTSAPPSTTSATSTPAPAGTTTTSTPTPASTGTTPTASGTRTAPEPKFAEGQSESSAAGLAEALATLRAHGYSASDTSDYHPDQTLRVLVGTQARSGSGQQAFFFVDGRYLGTDASTPSGQIAVVDQNDTEVTLAYSLYRSSDPTCCPGGGRAQVRFQLNDGRLAALDPIPASEPATGLARR